MIPERWEHGSEFHWLVLPPVEPATRAPWSAGQLLFSGRDALRQLIAHGMGRRGWRRLWVPDYFCQRVTASLVTPGLELAPYPDDPLRAAPDLPDSRPGDAVLVMNYFGLRETVLAPSRDGVDIVEDHSHDPWSAWAAASAADFCIASLRKTLPIPDGAALWSPAGHQLPQAPELTEQRRRATATRLAAMVLKALYLDGHAVDKSDFRALAVQAEDEMDEAGISGMSEVAAAVLRSFPVEAWRRARAANHRVLAESLSPAAWAQVLVPAASAGVPFSCVVLVDSARRREGIRRRLISANVYPAVLWTLEEPVLRVGDRALGLSRRVLSLHCDGRYGAADMERVGDLVLGSGGAGRVPRRVRTPACAT
jgi:hypothetical protein